MDFLGGQSSLKNQKMFNAVNIRNSKNVNVYVAKGRKCYLEKNI